MIAKLTWQGTLTAVQPRIRLTRSFDQRSHTYLGYVLTVTGVIGDEERSFTLGIGETAQAKHGFRVGDQVQGECLPVATPQTEPAEFYKVSKLIVLERSAPANPTPPPWMDTPPPLAEYRERGHRRLAARTYDTACTGCMWGCRMAVEIIVDHWNPGKVRYRRETFCYGPKSCTLYKPGPTRKVPGRQGMTWVEEDWVDEDATSHRGEDE